MLRAGGAHALFDTPQRLAAQAIEVFPVLAGVQLLRTYDPGAMYAPVTGYYSVVYGFTGIERSLRDLAMFDR